MTHNIILHTSLDKHWFGHNEGVFLPLQPTEISCFIIHFLFELKDTPPTSRRGPSTCPEIVIRIIDLKDHVLPIVIGKTHRNRSIILHPHSSFRATASQGSCGQPWGPTAAPAPPGSGRHCPSPTQRTAAGCLGRRRGSGRWSRPMVAGRRAGAPTRPPRSPAGVRPLLRPLWVAAETPHKAHQRISGRRGCGGRSQSAFRWLVGHMLSPKK